MALFRRKRAVVASAEPAQPGQKRAAKKLEQNRQRRAAEFATKLGVARFAAGLLADAGARCTLRAERLVSRREDAWEANESALPNELLARYRGVKENQRELVRTHIWHYETVGEAIQYLDDCQGRLAYGLASPFAVKWGEKTVTVQLAPGGTVRDGLAKEIPLERATRLWIADETWPQLASSSLMGVVDDCERYWTLGRRIQREADSALIGNGIIWTPSEAHQRLPREQGQPGQPGQPRTEFEADYYEAAARAFDPDTAYVEDVAPLLWNWPGAHGKPEKIDLASGITDGVLAARAEALECIARGLNYPQHLLISGGEGMNHWGAWLLEEQFAKNSLAPILERVCWGDLTETFFRRGLRALAAQGLFDDDPDDWRVGFDMTPVVAHPDQGKIAIELNTLGLLNDAKTMELNGFDSNDLLSPGQFARWIARQQAVHAQPLSLPVGPSDVAMSPPGAIASPPAALTAASTVRQTVLVGPLPGEELGWLDA